MRNALYDSLVADLRDVTSYKDLFQDRTTFSYMYY